MQGLPASGPSAGEAGGADALTQRIQALLKSAHILLFMKVCPSYPWPKPVLPLPLSSSITAGAEEYSIVLRTVCHMPLCTADLLLWSTWHPTP